MQTSADADHRLAGGHEFANVIQLLRRERSAANADQREIGLVEHLQAGEIVLEIFDF